eukprot:m.285622 g.285622  ORF g.285622 m.285622 type:complete len:344 (-) comp11416_c0_seq1:206-1237(-)
MDEERYRQLQETRRAEHLDFDVESWQASLGNLTFPSRFLPLKLAEARAIIALYQYTYNSRAQPSEADYSHLARLEANLAVLMMDQPGGNGWFVRLSTRSPKDAVRIDKSQYEEALNKALEASVKALAKPDASELPEDYVTNAKMVALSGAQAAMQVTSARQALELLCSSERAFVDLMMATHATETFASNPVCIVLREWEPRLCHDYEFRAFVSKGQLTAISQYNHYCYFPHIASDKQLIEDLLRTYWTHTIAPALQGKLASYVVDIAILSDGSLKVVELNPFAVTTGGALFDWRADRKLLEEGPFEMRVHDKPVPSLKDFVDYCVDAALEGQPSPAYFGHTKE